MDVHGLVMGSSVTPLRNILQDPSNAQHLVLYPSPGTSGLHSSAGRHIPYNSAEFAYCPHIRYSIKWPGPHQVIAAPGVTAVSGHMPQREGRFQASTRRTVNAALDVT